MVEITDSPAAPGCHTLVAIDRESGERVGYCVVTAAPLDDFEWFVPAIRVEAPWQDRGVGKALIQRVWEITGVQLVLDWTSMPGALVVGEVGNRIFTTDILTNEALSWLDAQIPSLKEDC